MPLCASSLQAFAGIVTVSIGHCHPEVVAAVNKQNQLLQHTTTIYLNNQIAEYAKELADKMPGNLKVRLSSSAVACCAGQHMLTHADDHGVVRSLYHKKRAAMPGADLQQR
jgi:acetylornithine/succinyldiaminopimelate/putrescine aminotransferase